ncbi:MAG: hypothetical protein LBB28_00095 [Synergistaceae bacterium]|nr:hypothetical protein [Synergistaceae bacterium]
MILTFSACSRNELPLYNETCRSKYSLKLDFDSGKSLKLTTDTGEGIEPERLPVIFERFKSRDSSKKRAANGTRAGPGLYIREHIAEAHGGEMEIASEAGVGTRVRFTIPVCR